MTTATKAVPSKTPQPKAAKVVPPATPRTEETSASKALAAGKIREAKFQANVAKQPTPPKAKKAAKATPKKKAATPTEKVPASYDVADLFDHLPEDRFTQGNRDAPDKKATPAASVKAWMEHRNGAQAVVENIIALYPTDVDEAANTLTIVALYETKHASSWSDAAQATGSVDVGHRSGPGMARDRYEKAVPPIDGATSATKIGAIHRAAYRLASGDEAKATAAKAKPAKKK
jgi:hypothetical protein